MSCPTINKLAEICKERDISYGLNTPLSAKCTFKIGGNADIFIEPSSSTQISELTGILKGGQIPYMFLGRGSNVLFPDHGYRGAVISLGERFSAIRAIDGHTIYCESGASLTALCKFALSLGLTGLEFAFGIPGSVGGAVYMNAGAYGGEISDVISRADHIDENGNPGGFDRDGLSMSYRESVYTGSSLVITGALFTLKKGDRDDIQNAMEDYITRRRSKQPLDYPSAGSTFKRPTNGYASRLIDECGLKGLRIGGAMVSKKHAGFVINYSGATYSDVLKLIEVIRDTVYEKKGVVIEPEIRIVE